MFFRGVACFICWTSSKSVLTEVLAAGMRYFWVWEDSFAIQTVSLTHTTYQQLLVNNLSIMEIKLKLHPYNRNLNRDFCLLLWCMFSGDWQRLHFVLKFDILVSGIFSSCLLSGRWSWNARWRRTSFTTKLLLLFTTGRLMTRSLASHFRVLLMQERLTEVFGEQ